MDATEKSFGRHRRRVYLMRHGEVDYFDANGRPLRPDSVPLNAEGKEQALAIARELADVPFDRVITSGLRRADETAALVIGRRTLELERWPELREIQPGHVREWGSVSEAEVRQAFVGTLTTDLRADSQFLRGETYGALLGRVLPCFQRLLVDSSWQHLLIVAHGVVNRALLCTACGAGLPSFAGLEQDAGCINLIDVDDAGRCLVRLINYTPWNPLKIGQTLTTMERLYLQYRRQDIHHRVTESTEKTRIKTTEHTEDTE
jgi:probable phosphoglycerate mutase